MERMYPKIDLETAIKASQTGETFHVPFYENTRSKKGVEKNDMTNRIKLEISEVMDILLSDDNIDINEALKQNPDLYLMIMDMLAIIRVGDFQITALAEFMPHFIRAVVRSKFTEYGIAYRKSETEKISDKLLEIMKLGAKLKKIIASRLIAQRGKTNRDIFRINSLPLPKVLHRADQMQPRDLLEEQPEESAFA